MQNEEFPFGDIFHWNEKSFLGEGSYGKVYKVKNQNDSKFYAIKQMKMDQFIKDPSLMNSLKGQIEITMNVNSEHTVQMLNYKIGKYYTYMILELCDGDLRKQLAERKFSETQCVKVFDQIMQGFKIVVEKGYIHRDIKPANVLVKNHHYKVADFGFACKADIFAKQKLQDICGTPIYMAPQLLKNQPYTAKSDIWSLGLMLYEMIFNFVPWSCRSLEEYTDAVNRIPFKIPYNAQIGFYTKDFLEKALVVNEQKRIGWQEVFKHPLITHMDIGESVKPIEVNDKVKSILVKMHDQILKHSIDVKSIQNKYRMYQSLNQNIFAQFMREIDPYITTHEINLIFSYVDKDHDGTISHQEYINAVSKIDFRDAADVISRKIDQIAAILKARNINLVEFFNQYDKNKSGSLDWIEFSQFILNLAPKYTKAEILQIFKLFDTDNSGLISKDQFMRALKEKLPSGKNYTLEVERAERNKKQLISFLKYSKISPQTLASVADKNHDNELTAGELEGLLSLLKYKISKEEVEEVFNYADKNGKGVITVREFIDLLK